MTRFLRFAVFTLALLACAPAFAEEIVFEIAEAPGMCSAAAPLSPGGGDIIGTTDGLCGTFPTLFETCSCYCKVCANPHLVTDPEVACSRCQSRVCERILG